MSEEPPFHLSPRQVPMTSIRLKKRLRRTPLLLRAPNNHHRGVPAGALEGQLRSHLAWLGLLVIGGGLAGYAWTGRASLGAFCGVVAGLMFVAGTRGWQGRVHSGASGERLVARTLRRVPDAVVFHDLNLGQENADHVVLTHQGIYVIETKNLAWVQVDGRGLWIRGHLQDRPLRQATRQSVKLRRHLKLPVTPVICFVHPTARIHMPHAQQVYTCTLGTLPARLRHLRTRGVPLTEGQVQHAFHQLTRLLDR